MAKIRKKPVKELPKNQKGSVPVVWIEKRQRWQLTVYVKCQKRRSYWKEEADAVAAWEDHVATIAKHGQHAVAYDDRAHREYDEAKRIVGGMDLRDVAAVYAATQKVGGALVKFSDALTEYRAHIALLGLSAAHLSGTRSMLESFEVSFGTLRCSEIAANDILKWLLKLTEDHKEKTVVNYRKSLSAFFSWADRRGYARPSPMKSISKKDLPTVPLAQKETLSRAQAAAMLGWLEANRPAWVPWFAVQLFGGIRRAEAARFEWAWCDFGRKVLNMPGWRQADGGRQERVVKTGDNWALHDLPAAFWAWLERYKGEGAFVVPTEMELRWLRTKVFPTLSAPIAKWPLNALRHTFCSILISLYSDAARVANWSRHSSPKELYQSYVTKLVSKEDAERFLAILPVAA